MPHIPATIWPFLILENTRHILYYWSDIPGFHGGEVEVLWVLTSFSVAVGYSLATLYLLFLWGDLVFYWVSCQ
jgi:hypothetical protein